MAKEKTVRLNGISDKEKSTYFVLVKKRPRAGQCLENFLRFNPKTCIWEEFISSAPITSTQKMGDTYIVHTKYNIFFTKIL